MKLIEYSQIDLMMSGVATAVGDDLARALSQKKSASIAVPGGSTPGPIFDLLCQADLNWAAISIMLTDERWVEMDSPRSNTALLKTRLLVNRAKGAEYVPLFNGAKNAALGAVQVSDSIEAFLPLDVLVLGMGADMHTASLFPAAPELPHAQGKNAPAVVAMTPGGDLEQRVSLSARALESAKATHIVIIGNDKRAALEKAQSLPVSEAPIGQFLPNATVHWCSNKD